MTAVRCPHCENIHYVETPTASPEGPPDPAPAAASAGKSESPGQEHGAPAKAWLVRLTCCGRDNGRYETATWAEADAFRNDYLDAPGHVRSAIIEAAAPLPEKPSESGAASAGLREVLDALVPHGTSASRLDLYGKHREGCAGDAKNIACSCGLIQSIARFHRAIARLRAASAGEGALRARDVAAYLLDRADQYETGSPCWLPLTDAARNVMLGEVTAAERNGDFDPELYARVAALAPAQREGK